MDAYIALQTGTVIEGTGRAPGTANGEIVFTTAYSGYEESLTDPSYEEQILTFAYPLIGNYGVREDRFESDRIHPRGTVAREFTEEVVEWFRSKGVVAVDGVDTRDLVLTIREEGAMRCGIAVSEDVSAADAREQLDRCVPMTDRTEIGQQVGVSEPVVHTPDRPNGLVVALLDCGVKRSIIDSFLERGTEVYRFPSDAASADVAAVDPDLFFISNGPGDPANFENAEALVTEFTGDLPVAGICLGQQVVARALGGDTRKLSFGHRGVNQPVQDLDTGQVMMTTQNHGYTVADTGSLTVTQVNINDGTAEGLANDELGLVTRQYHPEANPGPRDTLGFFDDMIELARDGHPHTIP